MELLGGKESARRDPSKGQVRPNHSTAAALDTGGIIPATGLGSGDITFGVASGHITLGENSKGYTNMPLP
jgi:hypothetical protein